MEHPYTKASNNEAGKEAQRILESRGASPRLYRNTLVFLAPDKARLQDLEDSICRYIAWSSILSEKETLDISPTQVKQAEQQLKAANSTVDSRLLETYQWLLVPVQDTPQSPVDYSALKVSGDEPLAARASKKLKSEELLILRFAPTSLRRELDKIPLWRGNDVSVRQLCEDFARYTYLPRLLSPEVLMDAIRSGIELLTWEKDSFAWADEWDAEAQRYRGLRAGQNIHALDPDSTRLLVKPDVAQAQMEREVKPPPSATVTSSNGAEAQPRHADTAPVVPVAPLPKRFHGTVLLTADRVGRDAGAIAEEIITHLAVQKGARVTVRLEIEAELPEGARTELIRTVTENARALHFTSFGFEEE